MGNEVASQSGQSMGKSLREAAVGSKSEAELGSRSRNRKWEVDVR